MPAFAKFTTVTGEASASIPLKDVEPLALEMVSVAAAPELVTTPPPVRLATVCDTPAKSRMAPEAIVRGVATGKVFTGAFVMALLAYKDCTSAWLNERLNIQTSSINPFILVQPSKVSGEPPIQIWPPVIDACNDEVTGSR